MPPRTPNFDAGILFPGCDDRLLPAIAQDATSGRVLMVAWMNEAAFAESLQTRRAVYYSRSRGELWRKGETSGHQQVVREIRIDCDADAILLLIDQTGAACHEGYASCFFRRIHQDSSIEIADERLVDPADVYRTTKK